MKKMIIVATAILFAQALTAQVWYTKTGAVSFFSHTEVEDIKADNNEAVSFIDASKGSFVFQVLIKGFKFPKASMQEHFNQPNYMDSDKYPKSEFKGALVNAGAVNFKKDGSYAVEVEGDMTMHGATKKIKVPGTIQIKGGVPSVVAKFMVKRSDFGISVPSFSAAKIAEEIEVTVKCVYEPYKQ
jgi:polyisoprenoid-binding protein YceI